MATEFKLSYTGNEVNQKLGKIDGLVEAETRLEEEIAVERARINQITTLSEGSTTGDAELQDIRVGHDGITYPNAGDAVRQQGERVAVLAEIHDTFFGKTEEKNIAISGNVTKRKLLSVNLKANTQYTLDFKLAAGLSTDTWLYILDASGNVIFGSYTIAAGKDSRSCSFTPTDDYDGAYVAYTTSVATTITSVSLIHKGEYETDKITVDISLTESGKAADSQTVGLILDASTASKNLNVTQYTSHTLHGITYTIGDDNSIALSGTATSETWICTGQYWPEKFRLPAGTYTVSSERNTGMSVYIALYRDDTLVEQHQTHDGGYDAAIGRWYKTFTTYEDFFARVQVGINNGTVTDGTILHIQLEKGDTLSEFVSPWIIEPKSKRLNDIEDKIDKLNESVFEFDVPPYYFVDAYLTNKIKTIKAKIQECIALGDAFVFITDAHWSQNAGNSPKLIKYITENLNINKVISGGDTGNAGGNEEFCKALQKCTNGRVYHVTGNHEYFYPATGSTCAFNMSMYNDDIHTSGTDRDYYYFDNNRARIRYVVLSSYSSGKSGLGASAGYETAQIEWLRDVALDVQDGWTIIVFSHHVYYMNLTTLALTAPTSGGQNMLDVLDAYNANENSKGKVACVVQGHTHYDRITHTNGGIPVVIVACDKYEPWMEGDTNKEPWLDTRVRGTITEQAFDVVVVDKANCNIYFYRIGASAMDGVDDNAGNQTELRIVSY